MKIILDAFGGDNAPLEILRGAAAAVRSQDVDIILTGDAGKIRAVMEENAISSDRMEIVHAPEVVEMCDDPAASVRQKRNSSMMVGLSLLAEGRGDAFISAGSTGALLAGATFLVKRIKGIKRAALAPLLPCNGGSMMLIDCGANVECRPEYLEQFGVMGSLYMEKVAGVENPRVGLVNIGTEDTKGSELQRAALPLLRASKIRFTGNVEARDIPLGAVDVAVCDGFTGNIVLKMAEGMGKFFSAQLKGIFYRNLATKLCALGVKKGIAAFKKSMDASEAGGAPLMGIAKPVIKAHGNSNARAIECAVRQAKSFAGSGMIEAITAYYAAPDKE